MRESALRLRQRFSTALVLQRHQGLFFRPLDSTRNQEAATLRAAPLRFCTAELRGEDEMGYRDTHRHGPVERDCVGPGRTGPNVPTRTITVTIVMTQQQNS